MAGPYIPQAYSTYTPQQKYEDYKNNVWKGYAALSNDNGMGYAVANDNNWDSTGGVAPIVDYAAENAQYQAAIDRQSARNNTNTNVSRSDSAYQSQVPQEAGGNSNYTADNAYNYGSGGKSGYGVGVSAPTGAGGGGYAGGSTGGGGGYAGGIPQAVVPPPPKMETVSIPDPAADPTYKYQHAALEKALLNYKADQTLGAAQYNTGYGEGLNKLGWDGKGWSQDNQGAYAQARGDNTSDFASRGLGRSSGYADSLGMIDKTFNDQKSSLDRGKTDYSDTQRAALGAYTDQNASTDHGALLDAISRIATQKGVDLSQVTPGKVGSITRVAS